MTEFALSLPILLGAGLGGIETANYVITNMQIAQTAVHIADNASRVGENSGLEEKKVFESDIDDVLIGANIQAGSAVALYEHGRVVISSVEAYDPDVHCDSDGNCASAGANDGDQFIHWQRCMGKLDFEARYGGEGTVLPEGIGPAGDEVRAQNRGAVMFVEVVYNYQPLISDVFIGSRTLSSIASFTVRDRRDITKIYQRDESSPDWVADCSSFNSLDAVEG